MKGYAFHRVFSVFERDLLARATLLVELIPEDSDLRCHELARVICALLRGPHDQERFRVVDGKYVRDRLSATELGIERGAFVDADGMTPVGVEHSWIEIERPNDYPVVLDVYCVGSAPMVQLRAQSEMLPHRGLYQATGDRTEIREACVRDLTSWLLQRAAMKPECGRT